MKKAFFVFVVVLNILFIGCTDKCVENNQPIPASFFVEILDETTGENVFQNETYSGTDIVIKDVLDNDIDFTFVEDVNIIQLLPETTIDARNIEIKIVLNNQTTLSSDEILIKYDVVSMKEECYTSFSFANILFPNNDSELIDLVFKVKI